jgi:hypothetical protein
MRGNNKLRLDEKVEKTLLGGNFNSHILGMKIMRNFCGVKSPWRSREFSERLNFHLGMLRDESK